MTGMHSPESAPVIVEPVGRYGSRKTCPGLIRFGSLN